MSMPAVALEQPQVSILSVAADLTELTKPRIATLVLIVVAVAMHVASFGQVNPWLMLATLVGTFGFAASACAVNQWQEVTQDRLMKRTAGRPLVMGRLKPQHAVLFAVATLTLGVAVTAYQVNLQATFWGLATWGMYVFAYTPLKTRTAANTAVGAIAGALPLFIGWSAVGQSLDYRAWALFVTIFLWQFPHFMAIAWLYRRDYTQAGFKMLTTVDPSGRRAGVQAVLAASALVPISLIPALALPKSAAVGYLAAATLLGVGQLAIAMWFMCRRDDLSARWLLRASLVYLPAILILLALIPWS